MQSADFRAVLLSWLICLLASSPAALAEGAATKPPPASIVRMTSPSMILNPPVVVLSPQKASFHETGFQAPKEVQPLGPGHRFHKVIFRSPEGQAITGITLSVKAAVGSSSNVKPLQPPQFTAQVLNSKGVFVGRLDASAGKPENSQWIEFPAPQRMIKVILEENGLVVNEWSAEAKFSAVTATAPTEPKNVVFSASSMARIPLAKSGATGHQLLEDARGTLWLTYRSNKTLYLARSPDGVHWQGVSSLFPNSGVESTPAFFQSKAGRFYLAWVSTQGGQVGLWASQARDGLHWSKPYKIAPTIPQILKTGDAEMRDARCNAVSVIDTPKGFLMALAVQYATVQKKAAAAEGSSFIYLTKSQDFRHWSASHSIYRGEVKLIHLTHSQGVYRIIGQALAPEVGVLLGQTANPDGSWEFRDTNLVLKGQDKENVAGVVWTQDAQKTEAIAANRLYKDGLRLATKDGAGSWRWLGCIDPTRLWLYGSFDLTATQHHGFVMAWTSDRQEEDAGFVQVKVLPYRSFSQAQQPMSTWEPLLMAGLSDANRDVRRDAAFLMRQVNQPETVSALIQLFNVEQDQQIRTVILDTLVVRADKRAGPVVIKALKDASPLVRSTAASAAQVVGGKEALPALLDLLKGENVNDLHARAIESIGVLGDAKSLPALVPFLHSKTATEAHYADSAVRAILGRVKPIDRLQALVHKPDPLLAQCIWTTLGLPISGKTALLAAGGGLLLILGALAALALRRPKRREHFDDLIPPQF